MSARVSDALGQLGLSLADLSIILERDPLTAAGDLLIDLMVDKS
jgi:hypothetical protein